MAYTPQLAGMHPHIVISHLHKKIINNKVAIKMVSVVVAALPRRPAAIAGVDQTGGCVYTPKSIKHRNRNANLQDKNTTPRCGTRECTQPAFPCHIHSQPCLTAVWWLILIKLKPKHTSESKSRLAAGHENVWFLPLCQVQWSINEHSERRKTLIRQCFTSTGATCCLGCFWGRGPLWMEGGLCGCVCAAHQADRSANWKVFLWSIPNGIYRIVPTTPAG